MLVCLFQVRFRPGLYPVEARQLSAPQIIVAKEAAIPNKNGDWSGGMKKSVLVPKSLVNWVVLYRFVFFVFFPILYFMTHFWHCLQFSIFWKIHFIFQ